MLINELKQDLKNIDTQLINKATKTFIYVDDFGAKGDGLVDDSDSIQAAFNSCELGSIVCFTNGKKYKISKTIYVSKDISIKYNWCTLVLATTNTFNNGFFMYYNVDSSGNAINVNPLLTTTLSELYVYPENLTFGAFNGIYICQQVVLKDITFKYIDQCIKISTEYVDRVVCENIYIGSRSDSSNYAINSGSQGDGRVFKNIQHGAWLGTSQDSKLLYIGKSHLQVYVRNIIGRVNIVTYSPTYFQNLMLSFWGVIDVYGADCKFNNIYASANGKHKINIHPYQYNNNMAMPNIIMENCLFKCAEGVTYEGIESPIYVEDFNSIKLHNVWSATGTTGQLNFSKSMCSIDGIDLYTKYSPYLNGITVYKTQTSQPFTILGFPVSSVVINALTTSSSSGTWRKPAGTYYYNLIHYIDYARKIGKFVTAERNIALTTTGVKLDIRSIRSVTGFARIFRGTVSGTYTEYVDIPLNENFMIDDGITINGYFWKTYTGNFSTETTELNNNFVSATYKPLSISECNIDIKTDITSMNYGTWQKYDCFGGAVTEKIYDGATWKTKWVSS